LISFLDASCGIWAEFRTRVMGEVVEEGKVVTLEEVEGGGGGRGVGGVQGGGGGCHVEEVEGLRTLDSEEMRGLDTLQEVQKVREVWVLVAMKETQKKYATCF